MKVDRKKRYRWFFGCIALVFLFLLFRSAFFLSILQPLSTPLSATATTISSKLFWWRAAQNITLDELQHLHEQTLSFYLVQAENVKLKDENAQLKEELNFVQRTKIFALPAAITSKSLSQSVSKFVIDQGTESGIKTGDAVVAKNGIYIGKITDSSLHSATVTALTHPTRTTAVSLLNERRTIGIVNGTSTGLLEMKFIPLEEEIAVNDLVVTSGLEEGIPSGLLVGIVNAVSVDADTLFFTAIVEPLENVRRISHVLVLKQERL